MIIRMCLEHENFISINVLPNEILLYSLRSGPYLGPPCACSALGFQPSRLFSARRDKAWGTL